MRSSAHSTRSFSVRSARSGTPAAPSSERAAVRSRASCLGSRLAASASDRARRAASTSSRHGTLDENGVSDSSASGAGPRLMPAT